MIINPRTTTKSNRPRIGKANITNGRYRLRKLVWEPLKRSMQEHLANSPLGEAKRMARACGINASQIHRFTCPNCEHDQEPCFTIGFTLLAYLSYQQRCPVIEIPKPKPERKPKLQRCNKTKDLI